MVGIVMVRNVLWLNAQLFMWSKKNTAIKMWEKGRWWMIRRRVTAKDMSNQMLCVCTHNFVAANCSNIRFFFLLCHTHGLARYQMSRTKKLAVHLCNGSVVCVHAKACETKERKKYEKMRTMCAQYVCLICVYDTAFDEIFVANGAIFSFHFFVDIPYYFRCYLRHEKWQRLCCCFWVTPLRRQGARSSSNRGKKNAVCIDDKISVSSWAQHKNKMTFIRLRSNSSRPTTTTK